MLWINSTDLNKLNAAGATMDLDSKELVIIVSKVNLTERICALLDKTIDLISLCRVYRSEVVWIWLIEENLSVIMEIMVLLKILNNLLLSFEAFLLFQGMLFRLYIQCELYCVFFFSTLVVLSLAMLVVVLLVHE